MTDDLVKRLRVLSGMTAMGEPINFGSDSGAMSEAADRIEGLEDENKRLLANAKTDAEFLLVYHQWCFKHGCAPSSSDLIAARTALAGEGL